MKMYVWSDPVDFMAVAHAESVEKARELLLSQDQLGPSGDGSCPERDRAREIILQTNPQIWYGPNAEFALKESAAVREAELTEELHRVKLREIVHRYDTMIGQFGVRSLLHLSIEEARKILNPNAAVSEATHFGERPEVPAVANE